MRKFLISIAVVASTTVFIATAAAWWVFSHPERAWGIAAHFLPGDLQVTWGQVQLQPQRLSWLRWGFDLQIKGLRILKGEPAVSLPVEDAELALSLSLFDPAFRVEVERLVIHVTHPALYEPGPSEENKPSERSLYQKLRKGLWYLQGADHHFAIKTLDVDVREIQYGAAANNISLGLSLTKPATTSDAEAIRFQLRVKSKDISSAIADGWLNATRIGGGEAFAGIHLTFDGYGAKGTSDIATFFTNESLRVSVRGPWAYHGRQGTGSIAPELTATVDEAQAELRLATSVADLPKPFPRIDQVEARFILPLQSDAAWSEQPGKFTVSAAVPLFFVDGKMRTALAQACQCKVPERLAMNYSGSVWLRPLFERTPGGPRVLESRLAAESVRNSLFNLDLAGGLTIFKGDAGFRFAFAADSKAQILSFKGVHRYLDLQGVIIPAPFDVLDGTVDLSAHSEIKTGESSYRMPVDVKVQLGSESQRVNLSSAVDLELKSDLTALNIFVNLLIDDLRIHLPPLDPLGGKLSILRDRRVQISPPAPAAPKASGFKVHVFYQAHTAHAGAIELLSKYANPYVPISVDIKRASDDVLVGDVHLEPFKLQYLRRTINVEQLRLLMEESEAGDFPVDGRFRIDQTQYRIFVEVSGTVRHPLIRLTSDPYLPKNEIISVLLYDRTSDQLISADAEAVGSFESAVADRAIGLFGLWAFASTPIRGFSYNPVTKVYAATLQLGDGLTAAIGTNWEEAAHLEVRKRVSRRWVLTASWAPSGSDGAGQVGKLVLQWEKRF